MPQLEPVPAISRVQDPARWQRQGQERFGPATRLQWTSPRVGSARLRHDQVPAMDQLRQTIRADSDLDGWMDTLVGPAYSRRRRDLFRTLHWFFNRLVAATGAYRLDEAVFKPLYAEFEQAWLTRTVVVTDYVPRQVIASISERSLLQVNRPGHSKLRTLQFQQSDKLVRVIQALDLVSGHYEYLSVLHKRLS